MNKDEMIKNDRRKIMDLLYKLKNGELCTPNCYGCCGDNELSFAYCPDVTDNFEKELANLGYREVADDEIVESMKTYERARQETAIEVADKIYNKLTESDVWHDMKKIWWRHNNECYELKGILKQILKELGVESED